MNSKSDKASEANPALLHKKMLQLLSSLWVTRAVGTFARLGLKAIPAAIIGGFASLPGAIVGGIILGVCESLAGFYLPEGFSDVSAYILVLVILALRPEGLFGEQIHKRV